MHSVLAFLFLATLNAGVQDPEAGITKLNDSQRLLRIESGRPLDSAAFLLAEDYHLHVNAEDPPFACPDDVIDTKPSQHFALAADHAYLPKGGLSKFDTLLMLSINPLTLVNYCGRLF